MGKCFPCFVKIWNHIEFFSTPLTNVFSMHIRHFKKLAFKHKTETYREGEQLHEFITIKFFTKELCTYWHSIQGSNFSDTSCRFTCHIQKHSLASKHLINVLLFHCYLPSYFSSAKPQSFQLLLYQCLTAPSLISTISLC